MRKLLNSKYFEKLQETILKLFHLQIIIYIDTHDNVSSVGQSGSFS